MIVYLSNCRGRDHVELFGEDAFYDLDTTGPQATKANNLRAGQQCIVATSADNGQVIFNWYSFSRENIKEDNKGDTYRVFFGKLIKSDTLLKRDAARDGLYSTFFDKNGNFKRALFFNGKKQFLTGPIVSDGTFRTPPPLLRHQGPARLQILPASRVSSADVECSAPAAG